MNDQPDLKNIEIRGVTLEELLGRIRELYVSVVSEGTL